MMAGNAVPPPEGVSEQRADDRRDILTAAMTAFALLLVLVSAWTLVHSLRTHGLGVSDKVLLVVLLLNAAGVGFGWRRFRILQGEIHRRRTSESHARRLATHDPLTGTRNRRALDEVGNRLIARETALGRPVAMLMIDLDHFKSVNDRYGHGVGDRLLQATSIAIGAALPDDALVARLGGDEFACLFAFDRNAPGTVDAIAATIVGRMAQPFMIGDVHTQIGASIGIARTDPDTATVDRLMLRADIALYAAKHAGRNRFAWFDAGMERERDARSALEQALRDALPRGEIVPYFEPQFDLATRQITGFEMLARWEHPDRGLIPPALFIPVAEECGLIGELSMHVIRAAMTEATGWDSGLSLAVNIAPAQMRDPWLAQKLVKLLTETGLPPERFEIELTETALFEDPARATAIIASIRNQGIRIAIDDFGTGYSSLTHLRTIPLDRIKIDCSFVTTMVDEENSEVVVRTVIGLAKSLGVAVLAEGVETAEIEALLRQAGCTTGQGWHLGRPMSARATAALLAGKGQLAGVAAVHRTGAIVAGRQDRLRAV
jgi:diguanylate cyclase (GGDEF)-like protein